MLINIWTTELSERKKGYICLGWKYYRNDRTHADKGRYINRVKKVSKNNYQWMQEKRKEMEEGKEKKMEVYFTTKNQLRIQPPQKKNNNS